MTAARDRWLAYGLDVACMGLAELPTPAGQLQLPLLYSHHVAAALTT
jgi:hypothetical protein